MPISSTEFFELWGDKHTKGSLGCTTGICNDKGGFMQGIAPIQCSCGGVIHGVWDPKSVNEALGPHEEFGCDKCGKNFCVDDLLERKRQQSST